MIAALRGEDAAELAHESPPLRDLHLPEHESSKYRYCTNFAVTGADLEGARLREEMLERIGDSVLVVGDSTTLRCMSTPTSRRWRWRFRRDGGEVSRLDVADMREQVAERSARLGARRRRRPCRAAARCRAVANGAG